MTMSLGSFAEKYPPQIPRIPANPADQSRPLDQADGVVLLTTAPFPEPTPGVPGRSSGCHLWVILPAALPVLLETAPRVRPPPLQSGVAKHTNLTGGGPACAAGELWVDAVAPDLLYVNGESGRYGPRTPAQVADAGRVFEGLGYRIVSAGWDEDNDRAAKTFRKP